MTRRQFLPAAVLMWVQRVMEVTQRKAKATNSKKKKKKKGRKKKANKSHLMAYLRLGKKPWSFCYRL
jgi:hypothetical protein